MVIINNTLYASVKELTRYGFSRSFLDKQCSDHRSGTIATYQNTKAEGGTHIAIHSIPEATRQAKGMPALDELAQLHTANRLASLVAFSSDAYSYYIQNPATHKVAKEKAEQASWLLAIAKLKPSEAKLLGFNSKDELYQHVITQLNSISSERGWSSWRCTSLAEFKKRLTPFSKYLKEKCTLAQACGERVSKKVGNSNAQKLGTDQHALLVQIYSDANAKPNFDQTWSIYMRKAREMVELGNWNQDALISLSAVKAYLMKPDVRQLWYEARHGRQQYRNTFEPVTQRQRPTYANALWVIDGTPSHRYFQHGEKGRYFRFNIFPVLDAHSWCVLGFWLSETEDTESVLGALRSACMVTGNMPDQILYDNSSAIQSFRAQDAIHKIALRAFPAAAGNARAKIIEPFFHHFNQDVQKFRPGYTANPFAITLSNRPNREALARLVKSKELPLAENALRQAIEDLTIWNNKPRKFLAGKSPLQTYRASVAATAKKQRPFVPAIDVDAFYTIPGAAKKIRTMHEGKATLMSTFVPQTYEYTNYGIEIVINGKKCFYEIQDPHFRRLYTGQRFSVRYEPNPERWNQPDQPDELLLYLNDAPFQWYGHHARALVKELAPMAVADYQPGSGARIREMNEMKKQQRSLVQSNFDQLISRTKRNGTYTEVITANAFDKDTLNEARANRMDMIIDGTDYKLDKPRNRSDEDSELLNEIRKTRDAIEKKGDKNIHIEEEDTNNWGADLDRLADYNKDKPID